MANYNSEWLLHCMTDKIFWEKIGKPNVILEMLQQLLTKQEIINAGQCRNFLRNKKSLSEKYFNRINVALECLNGFVEPCLGKIFV